MSSGVPPSGNSKRNSEEPVQTRGTKRRPTKVDVSRKFLCKPPETFKRSPGVIPFHIPHKKLLEKLEAKEERPEPLTNLRALQQDVIESNYYTTYDGYGPEEASTSAASISSLKTKGSEINVTGVILPHHKLSDVVNQIDLIKELRQRNQPGYFVYLVYAVPRSSEHYDPYALTIVPYGQVDKKNFLTMSCDGVLQHIGEDAVFTRLDKWEAEYKLFCRLMKIKTFFYFRIWKAFYVWKKHISFEKFNNAKKFLKNNLFILNDFLRDALLNIQNMCSTLSNTTFTNTTVIEEFELFYFIEEQMDKLETITDQLKEFRVVVKEIVSNACHGALLSQGFIIDESLEEESGLRKRIGGEKRLKTSYIEQANKKNYSIRLTCYIILADYLMINMLHRLMKNSTIELLDAFKKHYAYLPSKEKLESTEVDAILEDPRPETAPQNPLFFNTLTIEPEGIHLVPSLLVTTDIFNQIIELWNVNVRQLKSFIGDPIYYPFTNPIINGKVEDRICGYGPTLSFYLNKDSELIALTNEIFEVLTLSFEGVETYIRRFDFIYQFYAEDVAITEHIIKNERSLETFRSWCTRYIKEKETINSVVDRQPLGLINLQLEMFKANAIPEPDRLLGIIHMVMPFIGKEKVDALIKEVEEDQMYLEKDPVTTIEYVKYLEFIEEAQARMDEMENELDYCKELYDIMEEFDIIIPNEDLNNYLGISVTMGTLRNTIDTKAEFRPIFIKKFNDQMNKDISALIGEVGTIKDKCLEPWLYDIDSNIEEVTQFLTGLHDHLVDCQRRAAEFKGYQKQFRLEVTRFDMLDEVMNDVKLRMLLWESVESWGKTVTDWYVADFNSLNVEDMNMFTAKNVKNIIQLEKGLPKNLVVPKLKEDVEAIKDKLPVITYLRNPAFKQRHWIKIENLLNYKFKPEETLNLALLEDLKVFSYPQELMEISGQASSEASLEALLKKVEEAWKVLEFVVIPHRDSKDVFILGTVEEIQQVLDDSNININTIASSRHVGPIKSRVEEWIRLLDLFSKTLDEWLTCQQSWIYLEVIFSAPDIQRQLPNEAKMFLIVDKSWKEIMRKTAKMPLAMEAATQEGLLEKFVKNNEMLEQIMKCLESYLETKRVSFPRFYFLSNDELLDILAQTRNPHAVQPHLRKCFDAIQKLEFAVKEDEEEGGSTMSTTPHLTTDIIAMISPEGERVALGKGLKARGNVEDWLGKVEENMIMSLRKIMKLAIVDYTIKNREEWVLCWPNQIVLAVSQIHWAKQVHAILDNGHNKQMEMEEFQGKCIADLNKSAALIRGDLSSVTRKIICALITIDVHARDTISALVQKRTTNSNSFDWLKMLRYYWQESIDDCVTKMSSASYVYGYEYLGAGGVLVITPLTDRCYLCLMGALQLDLGGSPAGPAGTGKTETTKDLAKALAFQCVVFNCSEGLDYKIMGRFFSGLAQSGGWSCFDEFNRIDIEVLSVIAQQIITIRNAKAAKLTRFMFEGREIKLVHTCATFITMNPGYAGRTELPDNLKALFRPIAMMVPDYALIAEVILYSEGFESSKNLANKMVQMYKLCSEQLSQQDHYDFGMRAVKSVLVMAGALKRANPDRNEDVVLICALRDSNLPKFLADDAILFQGILTDLFPGVELPVADYGEFEVAIVESLTSNNLQPEPCIIRKVIQLYETMNVRWGVMLVGPTGGGKTTTLNTLGKALSKMFDDGVISDTFQPVHKYIMNPKAVTAGELYGEVNPYTLEWRDGLMGIMVRTAVQCTSKDHQWIICDGPVDAVWIENLNTVLDDNKMLCLANSERIKLTPYVHMVFEVMDLAQASPATVSRCGMVYIDSEDLKWLPYVKTWLNSMDDTLLIPEMKEFMLTLFESYVESGFVFVKKHGDFSIHQVDVSKAAMICCIVQSLLEQPGAMEKIGEKSKVKCFLCQSFIFAYVWGLGGNLNEAAREKFEAYVREQFDDHPDARIPPGSDLWQIFINTNTHRFDPWTKIIPFFQYDPNVPFFETLVPTIDTVRFGFIMELLLAVNHPVFFTGETGVGKSVIVKYILNKLLETGEYVPITLNFSAQTSSMRTQEILELKLEKRKKTLIGAPLGKKVVVFVDDVNMPKLEKYGAQPPIELLRQFMDYRGLYDREKLFWKDIVDVVIVTACAPPGGGRNSLTPRFVRHFGMMLIPPPNEYVLKAIFKAIMKGFLKDFASTVQDYADSIVNAAVEIYERIAEDLLPTPAKSHYVFNLRDLSKCIQGLLQADSGTMRDGIEILRLFYHESLRVFHDRLINIEDKSYFFNLMREICNRAFGTPVLQLPDEGIITNPPMLLFGDFMVFGSDKSDRIYEEIKDVPKLKGILQDYMEDYNLLEQKDMKLIFFMDAIEHTARIARILRAERGNGLLVGVGGMGKQSLTRLASHLNSCKCFQIEITRNYDHVYFFEDLRRMYFRAGCKNESMVFLFTDTQIVQEDFLEDINNILNSGEVPNLFESDEYEKVMIETRPSAKDSGIKEENRDGIYEFFINRVRQNLHLVLCMSPVGDAFRRRCRMFPSLVNCCTIDWFTAWPQDALLSVAERNLVGIGSEDMVHKLSIVAVEIHESVENMTERFYTEMRRHYYTTPSSYLELLKMYKNMLKIKIESIIKTRERIANGLQKLYETNSVIDSMKAMLKALEPELAKKSKSVADLMKTLQQEQKQADKVRIVVKKDEEVATQKANETQALAEDAQKDLEIAMPAYEMAVKALEALNKNDINELRVFQKPPKLVQYVMESVCLLLGAKTDWASAKLVMGDSYFLKKLQDYDKDHIPESTLRKLKTYIDNKDFVPDVVVNVSKVCKSMCMWVRAIDTYAKIYKVVAPKKKRLEEAEKELNQVMGLLIEKQRQLAEVEAMIAKLEEKFNETMAEKEALEAQIDLTAARLHRAARLNTALGDEQTRWEQSVKDLKDELSNTTGDVLLAAASVAYLGAFTSTYRKELVNYWIEKCIELEIPASNNFCLITVLADPYEIRHWNACGLPRDSVSTENGILVTKAGRWPLMIDPQEQANRWIKQMEGSNQLQIMKLTDSNFLRVLESAIRLGLPVLLEEVGETLDPTLAPILTKQTFLQGGRLLIRLGDSDVDYDANFRFYVTTKLPNPHYLPEICIQVTIVNFTVTPTGLEDQLLADVVSLEKPELENQRTELIIRINTDKTQLKNIEDKILRLLYTSEGYILDNEELINTLNESKETSAVISARLVEAETTEGKISIAREKYRIVATRGSVLYFVVAQLAEIDPMYQYSLKYFSQVFNTVVQTTEPSEDLSIRLNILIKGITMSIYTNVSRGLFERHKLVFSFMLCVAIYTQKGEILDSQWNFLLRGPIGAKVEADHKPDEPLLTDAMWTAINFLKHSYACFHDLPNEALRIIRITLGDTTTELKVVPEAKFPSNVDWDTKLDDFNKLLLIKTLQEDKLVFAITSYVKKKLGQPFIESPQISLNNLYQDTSNVTPLIFVLSTGSDPFASFLRFAADMGFKDKIQAVSLGQGQGPVAEKLIEGAKPVGDWVFLQNCHLATSWMLPMERILLKIADDPSKIHTDFRIFLSSMPSKSFPVAVLQNSVKVTNEPPKGLRANIKRAFLDMMEDFFENNSLGQKWRTMLFGICMFHAVVQERKKFGPLGWNIVYEFNDSDREFAFNTLKMYCERGTIPWDALEYITGEITYGGRVTDYWDLRCLKTILKMFFAPHTLASHYTYSKSGIYYCPQFHNIEAYRDFIEKFPLLEEPEIFGMHENANIAFQTKETQNIVRTIMESQPRTAVHTEGKSSDEIVYEVSMSVVSVLFKKIDPDEAHPNLFTRDDRDRLQSLTTVLLQEVDRYNKLLKLIHSSISNLQKAIKGLVVMSESLEEVFTSFMNNQVPKMWADRSYPSLKTLASWVHDLELRLDFICIWLRSGNPTSYWLSGFYFPQGFLTGTLQTHARKYNLPIDQLKYEFDVTQILLDQDAIKKAHEVDNRENFDVYLPLQHPEDGVIVHGLFLDAGRWDLDKELLVDAKPGEVNPPLPSVFMTPVTEMPADDKRYCAPLYKTSIRKGVLSTTGHSTNFVIAVLLPSAEKQSYWILKGTALLTQISD